MRLPQTPSPDHRDTVVTAQATVYATLDFDEDVAIGWECANPSLQIEAWKEEASAEQPLAAY